MIKIKIAQLNAFVVFALLPWLTFFAPALLAYGLLVGLLVLNRKFIALLLFFTAAGAAYALVEASPVREILSPEQSLNAYNSTFGWLIVLSLLFLKQDIALQATRLVDALMLAFAITGLSAYYVFGIDVEAIIQIMGLTFAPYFAISQRHDQRIMVAAYMFLSGGRANALGFILAVVWDQFRYLRAVLSLPALIGLLALVASGSAAVLAYEYLQDLQNQAVYMKGRTAFWIGLLENPPDAIGAGAGYSLLVIEQIAGFFQLPHNDWLRVYSEFGYIGLITTLLAVVLLSQRGDVTRFATVVLGVSMVFDNTLSYPTAMAAYFIVCQSRSSQLNKSRSDPELTSPATQPAGGAAPVGQ
ncbi:MAG: hypothetical protein AAF559_04230 [Pseudomonadota bacterium]